MLHVAEQRRLHGLCCIERLPSTATRKPSDFDKGFEFTGLVAGNGGGGFDPNTGIFTMIVDRGGPGHVLDDELVPWTV